MIITGLARLGRDAELRHTTGDNAQAVASLALAFNYGQKGSDGSRPTQWIEASLWGKRAEALAPYLTKGLAVDVVLSEPHIETYPKRDGGEGFKLVARVLDIELAGGGERRESSAAPQSSAPAPQRQPAASKPASGGGMGGDYEDDIPFAPIGRGTACHAI